MSYSIWLIPDGEVYKTVSSIIQNIAKEYGGPLFEPHITLLGGFGERKRTL